ncbi:MAG: N-6 DNA methylase [Desulfobulbaceae bacterium]
MEQYKEYSRYVWLLVKDAFYKKNNIDIASSIKYALDGQPTSELLKRVHIDKIRDAGAFFTNSSLAQKVLKRFLKTIDSNSVIYDPACGAGDLLLACADQLLVHDDFSQNIYCLERKLIGRDLYNEFIEVTKARLILLAISNSKNVENVRNIESKYFFQNIKAACGLQDISPYSIVTHIVANPPFVPVLVPKGCQWWGRGKVNQAAVFLANILEKCRSGTEIIAILPDVLRSGPMYRKWREYISSKAQVSNVTLHGKFGINSEIDVFSIELVAGKGMCECTVDWGYPKYGDRIKLQDYFEIHIGPVVDFRHPHEGEKHPFIEVDGLSSWSEVSKIKRSRRFTGRVFSPPFVVVRRNSRKDDYYRAVGTIINNSKDVAVENHLIVLMPRDNSIEKCRKLLDNLKNIKTKEWFDKRVCCRHLTVSALKELPWWE